MKSMRILVAIFVIVLALLAVAATQIERELELGSEYLQTTVTTGSMFGSSVAVSGNIAAATAMKASVKHEHLIRTQKNAGIVEIYELDGSKWIWQQTLHAEDAATNDNFGFSVALDKDVLVVGSWHADIDGVRDAGAAYVYEQQDGLWRQSQKLTSPLAQHKGHFGVSVAVYDGKIVVGAQGQSAQPDAEDAPRTGSAYVFNSLSGTWLLESELEASTDSDGALFGRSVAIGDKGILVGAPKDQKSDKSTSGLVSVYKQTDSSTYQLAQTLSSNGLNNDLFGESISMDGDFAAVGSWHDDELGKNAGAAYVFEHANDQWALMQKILPSAGLPNDKFGFRLDISANSLLVGAHLVDGAAGKNSGAAYLYELTDGSWREKKIFSPKRQQSGANFGRSVAIGLETVLVGAENAITRGEESGEVYVYSLQSRSESVN